MNTEYLNDKNPWYSGIAKDYIEGKISFADFEEKISADDGMTIYDYLCITESEIPWCDSADFYRSYTEFLKYELPKKDTPEYEKMEEERAKWNKAHYEASLYIGAVFDALIEKLKKDGYDIEDERRKISELREKKTEKNVSDMASCENMPDDIDDRLDLFF